MTMTMKTAVPIVIGNRPCRETLHDLHSCYSKTSGAPPTCASSATSAPARARSCPSPTCSRGRSTSARRRSASATPESPSPDHSLDYCSGCGVCTLVCPHGVKVMEINTAAKAELRKTAVARESARPATGGATGCSAATRCSARWAAGSRRSRTGDGVPAGADADGKDGRHRPGRAVPHLPLHQVPRLVLRPAPA